MLESVYIKTGGTDKCFGSDSGGHGSGETINLTQGVWVLGLEECVLLLLHGGLGNSSSSLLV
jgi:hypothetical protein